MTLVKRRHLVEYPDFFKLIEEVECEADIKAVKDSLKPFKGALNDLVTQSNLALISLRKGYKASKKTKELHIIDAESLNPVSQASGLGRRAC